MGRFDPKAAADSSSISSSNSQQSISLPQNLKPGARCLVGATQDGRRGTVRFVGSAEFAPTGVWVGVEYDEPVGKNDGR